MENKKEQDNEYDEYLRDIYKNEKPEPKAAKEIAVIFEDQDDFLGLAKLCCCEIRVRMRTQQKELSDAEYKAAQEEYEKSIENAFGDIDKE